MSAILRRAFTRGVATLALLSTACLDDRPVGPNDDARGPAVRLGFQATILGAVAGQTVHIRAFYLRLDGTDVTLESAPTEVSVTPGVPQQVAVVVRIAQCLADPQHTGGSPKACEVGIDLTLEDEDGTIIDEQTSPPTQGLPPGSTTTIGQPITFAPVAQVRFGSIPVLRQGETRTLAASALDGQGNAIASRPVRWSSDSPTILTIDPTTGAVTAVAVGSARVTAVAGVRSATTTVRVIRRVVSVVVSPDPAPTVLAAATLPLVATAKAASGVDVGDLDDRTITWAAVNPAGPTPTATVSANGTVTGVYPGDADVTVSIDGVTKTVRVRVNAARIEVQSASTVALVGATMPFKATVLDANDAPLANVPVTWSTSNPAVATVDASGLVTAGGQGLATITVTGGGATGTAFLHVTTLELDLQPATLEILAGDTARVSATNATGPVTWASTDTSIATVSETGVVTASYPGTVPITGTAVSTFGTQWGTAEVVVTGAIPNEPESGFIATPRSAGSGANVASPTIRLSPRK